MNQRGVGEVNQRGEGAQHNGMEHKSTRASPRECNTLSRTHGRFPFLASFEVARSEKLVYGNRGS